MTATALFGLILAAIWGAFWALFLQTTGPGKFLAARRAWLTVVIGIGVDLAILWALIPAQWPIVAGVITASSIGIIARSLANEWHDHRALVDLTERRAQERDHGHQDPPRQ